MQPLKLFQYLQVVIFLKLTSLNFPSCLLLQVNHCQILIYCLIMKRNVHKQKQILILSHIVDMMITFNGLTKKTDNAYAVI